MQAHQALFHLSLVDDHAHTEALILGHLPSPIHCHKQRVVLQGLQQVATLNKLPLTILTPTKLRQGLLAAGNIVQQHEIKAVLAYATADKKYEELQGLYLALPKKGPIKQIFAGASRWQQQHVCLPDSEESQSLYDLLLAPDQQLVVTKTWSTLAR